MSTSSNITLYDTTLRDGAQGEGIHFSLADKLRIAQRLDAFGMTYIEGGWPGSNEKDIEFFREAKKLKFKHAKLAAFGSTRRANTPVAKDQQVALLLEAGTPVVTLVCKTSRLHVEEILRTTLDENLAMIRDTISYLVQNGREVIFDGEHTFDGYKADPAYTTACYQAADEAGASHLVLCDTNGGSLPSEIAAITSALLSKVKKAKLGIHTHDDCGLGVANALASIQAGALQVQGTVNGYGERTGNCNLVTTIANLQLKMGQRVLSDESLAQLRDLSLFVDEVANQRPSGRAPFVGSAAFAHKGGIHVNAVNKLAASYEHIQPELVGNFQRVLVGELAGRANIMLKAKQFNLRLKEKSENTLKVLQKVKGLENKGYEFEAADASFELLIRRIGRHKAPFELVEYDVSVHKAHGAKVDTAQATLKLKVADDTVHEVSEGDGPVNALDGALRKALLRFFPELKSMKLVDYKVRIVDSKSGSAARTRVFVESSDGETTWTTVGVSTNIIEASWIALADSYEYLLAKKPKLEGLRELTQQATSSLTERILQLEKDSSLKPGVLDAVKSIQAGLIEADASLAQILKLGKKAKRMGITSEVVVESKKLP